MPTAPTFTTWTDPSGGGWPILWLSVESGQMCVGPLGCEPHGTARGARITPPSGLHGAQGHSVPPSGGEVAPLQFCPSVRPGSIVENQRPLRPGVRQRRPPVQPNPAPPIKGATPQRAPAHRCPHPVSTGSRRTGLGFTPHPRPVRCRHSNRSRRLQRPRLPTHPLIWRVGLVKGQGEAASTTVAGDAASY